MSLESRLLAQHLFKNSITFPQGELSQKSRLHHLFENSTLSHKATFLKPLPLPHHTTTHPPSAAPRARRGRARAQRRPPVSRLRGTPVKFSNRRPFGYVAQPHHHYRTCTSTAVVVSSSFTAASAAAAGRSCGSACVREVT